MASRPRTQLFDFGRGGQCFISLVEYRVELREVVAGPFECLHGPSKGEVLVKPVECNYGVGKLAVEREHDRLLRLFPSSTAPVQHDDRTSEVVRAIKNFFEMAAFAKLETDAAA